MGLGLLAPVNSDSVRIGDVVLQKPTPGARILRHGTVRVALSLGPVTHRVPLVGARATVADATAALVAAGLQAGPQTRDYSSTVPSGLVLRTDPAAGVTLRHGSPVGLVLSGGPRPVAVPRLKGALAIAATDTLTRSGLKGVIVQQNSDTVASGVVIDQQPAVGAQVPPGSTITYDVSIGPVMVTVPDVKFASVDDAAAALTAAGFTVKIDALPGGFGSSVVATSPRASTSAPEHSQVTIYAF